MPLIALGAALTLFATLASANAPEWPQWRGPFNNGMAAGDAPLQWGANDITWQREIPGRGHSTPVVSGNRMFLTTAVPTGKGTPPATAGRAGGGADAGLEHRFDVLAIDRATGKTLWQRTAAVATPHEGYHRIYGSFASNSPVTDGTRVFAFFGSRGLYAYDLDGALALAEGLRREDADGHGLWRRHAAHAARRSPAAPLRSPRYRISGDARPGHRPRDLAHQAHRAVQLGGAVRRPS